MSVALHRRLDDAIKEHVREKHTEGIDRTVERSFVRIEALERGLVGTPEAPGLVGHFAAMKIDVDHKLDRLGGKMGFNNWLTGAILALIVAQFGYMIFR